MWLRAPFPGRPEQTWPPRRLSSLAGAWQTENHSLRDQGWWLSGRQARLLMRWPRSTPDSFPAQQRAKRPQIQVELLAAQIKVLAQLIQPLDHQIRSRTIEAARR